jgi:hypothetical protein
MCGDGVPASVAEALQMLERALDFLNAADAASLPGQTQADALRGLERAEAKQTAARARLLSAFSAQGGFEADGQGSARTWLRWQTRITRGAAAGAVAWARRLCAHPAVEQALAAGEISVSWARAVCEWAGRLPEKSRDGAVTILVAAARAGADLRDLAGLAEEVYERSRGVPDDRFDERYLRLGITFGGAGRLEGDLEPGCAAAVSAVLDSLGKRAGPEDTRTAGQRRHDALEEACRRLIGAGMVPGRAGQPAHVLVHITLSQLRGMPGAREAEAAWARARATELGWLRGPEAGAAACDATLVPVVTGTVDRVTLERLASVFLAGTGPAGARGPLPPQTRARLRQSVLHLAADALSGPDGLAAWLRRSQLGPADGAAASLPLALPVPLDTGLAEPTIPAHVRRAVTARHSHCAFPGCDQPASVCQVHHLIPRARGGPAALHNLVPLCSFHHLIAVHRWGWQLTLYADGTTTAASPDGKRVLRSHGPPRSAA